MVVQLPGTAPQTPPPAAYVAFSAGVNAVTMQHLLNTMVNCANQNIPEVHLLLSTGGGGIMEGINFYNVVRGMPFKLVTYNVANVDSIGNAMFLAGEERYACPHSTFMFHGVAFAGDGQPFDVKRTEERFNSLRADEARLINIVTERTTMDEHEVRGLYENPRTMTAAEARDAGIAHEVRDVAIPPGVPVATFVFNG